MALVGFEIVLVIVGAVPVSNSTDADYVHRVEPATNGTLAYGTKYDDSDVLTFENLSERGQTVFNHARIDSPYVVENESATASDFAYTSDYVALGHGLYPIRYSDDIYSLRTDRQTAGFNAAAWFLSLLTDAFLIVGIVVIIAGVLIMGWRRYDG